MIRPLAYFASLFFAANAMASPPLVCLETDFLQERHIPVLENPLILNGHLRAEGQAQLHWQIVRPYSYSYRVDNEVILETLPDGSERRLSLSEAPWLEVTSQLFGALMTGDTSSVDQFFIQEADSAPGVLTLIPRNDALASVLTSVKVTYTGNGAAGIPESLTLEMRDGDLTVLNFYDARDCSTSKDAP